MNKSPEKLAAGVRHLIIEPESAVGMLWHLGFGGLRHVLGPRNRDLLMDCPSRKHS